MHPDGDQGATALHVALPSKPESARTARRTLAAFLADERFGAEARDDAMLVVSELVTNAVVHGGEHISLRVAVVDGGIDIAVSDGDGTGPALVARRPSHRATTGRGLHIIDAVASEWGEHLDPVRGRTVWAHLGTRG